MSLATLSQDDFSAGMWQAPDVQQIPVNGVYDIVNGLVDADEGVIYRRGGSTYKGNAAAYTMYGIHDVTLAGGQRTIFQTRQSLAAFAADDATITDWNVALPVWDLSARRGAVLGGAFYFPVNTPSPYSYGGSRKTANYTTGTVTVTADSTTVTGSGTAWVGNIDAGMILDVAGNGRAVVETVNSNTQLTLTGAWGGTTAAATAYSLVPYSTVSVVTGTWPDVRTYLAAAGNRLWVAQGSRVHFSTIAVSYPKFVETDYHEMGDGGEILGLQATRDRLMVFTTAGIFLLSNIALDLTDAVGNPQHRLDHINQDLILWDDNGLTSWNNAIIAPCTDDVYLLDGVSAPVSLGGPIRTLYRSYVDAGYLLGLATVYREHYILPIVDEATGVTATTLVCRLSGRAWSRMSGFSGLMTGVAVRRATTNGPRRLFGVKGTRVIDATSWFAPTAEKNDADGTTHTFSITTRDYTLGTLKGLAKRFRLWIEGVDAGTDNPTVDAAYATGLPGSSFTSLGSVSAESTGDTPLPAWMVNKGGKRIRFKISSVSPFVSLKVKALDLFVRPKGRV